MNSLLQNFYTEILKPIKNESMRDWIEKNARQPDGTKYSMTWAHVMQEVIESVQNTKEVSVTTIPQFAKTSTAVAIMQFWAQKFPGSPIMYVSSNRDKLREFRDEQFIARCEQMIEFKELLPPTRELNLKMVSLKNGTTLHMASGQSTGDAKSTPVRFLVLDEIDEYKKYKGAGKKRTTAFTTSSSNVREEPIVQLYKKRTRSYDKKGARTLKISTPSLQSEPIWQEYLAGDQSQYHLRCPGCKELFYPTIADFEWDNDRVKLKSGDRDLEILKETCALVHKCGAQITDKNRWTAVTDGKWIAQKPIRSATHRSFQIPAFLTTSYGIYETCRDYLLAKDGQGSIHGFFNATMCLPYTAVGKKREVSDMYKINTYTNYIKNKIPVGDIGKVLLSCDVQGDSIPYVVRILTKTGSYLIDYGHFVDLDVCYNYIKEKKWKTIEGGNLFIDSHIIDTGYKAKRQDGVYKHIERVMYGLKGSVKVIGAKGVDQRKRKMDGPLAESELSYLGFNVPILNIGDDWYKNKLYHQVIPKAVIGEKNWFLPTDLSSGYVDELVSETLVVIDEKTGEKEWQKQGKNDIGDCEKYALAFEDYASDYLEELFYDEEDEELENNEENDEDE